MAKNYTYEVLVSANSLSSFRIYTSAVYVVYVATFVLKTENPVADTGDEYRAPLGVTCDDDEPKGCVRVTAVIPDIEVKKGLFNRKTTLANGTITKEDFQDQSLTILIELQTKPKPEKYRVMYRKLPDKIVPSECYYKFRPKQLIITLKKAEDRSWQRELSTTGLETQNPDET